MGQGIGTTVVGLTGTFTPGTTVNLLTTGEATMLREDATSGSVTQASGVLRLTFFTARKTETITTLRLLSGSTAAAATPTLVRAGIYTVAANGDLTLAASIASDTTLFASTNTVYDRALSASYAKVAGTRLAVGVLVVTGATAPTTVGAAPAHNVTALTAYAPRTAGALTGQTDLPASISEGSLTDSVSRGMSILLP